MHLIIMLLSFFIMKERSKRQRIHKRALFTDYFKKGE